MHFQQQCRTTQEHGEGLVELGSFGIPQMCKFYPGLPITSRWTAIDAYNRPAVAPIRIDIKLRGFEPLLIFLDERQSIAILRCKMLQRLRVSVHISKYLEEPTASLVRGFNSQV